MEGSGCDIKEVISYNFKVGRMKRLWPNTDIIVEFKRKWKRRVSGLMQTLSSNFVGKTEQTTKNLSNYRCIDEV